MWRGYSVSTSECSPGIKWSSFVKKCALARALSLGTFMLSAYLDFIDIANFIFLVGRAGATGAPDTARKSGDVCNGWSTVEWYFLEQTAGKSAHKCSQRKSFQIGMCSNYRKRKRERERDGEKRQTDHECIACKELLFCLIFQDVRSLQKRLLPSIFAYFIHRFRNEQYVLFRSAKRTLFILPDNYEESIRINIITFITMREYSGYIH